MKRTLVLTAALLLVLVACEAEVQLEPAPEGILQAGDCPPPTYNNGDGTVTLDWGSAGGNANTFSYDVNEGYSVTFCLRHGSDASSLGPVTGSGSLTANGLDHWSVITFVPPPTSTVAPTTMTPTTDTTADETTTSVQEVTTLTAAAVTTTGGPTTTASPEESTTSEAPTTTAAGATTVTAGGGDVGGGDLTTTIGEGQTSTTGADIAGGSDETLPTTGRGNISLLGLAGMTVVGGIILLALARRRPDSD
ncbi:MAG: LPXTG cell wall anchor domain-containing protein [Acidimicrobiia bacterium]